VTTKSGRVRSAVTKYLEIYDRLDKCAQRLGVEREAMSLAAIVASVPPNPEAGNDGGQ
jgi:hypothetical protein